MKPLARRIPFRASLLVLGLPLVCLPLAGALAHFILEQRFNRALLFDLVARPALKVRAAA